VSTAAARDAWESHEGKKNGQNDPATGLPFAPSPDPRVATTRTSTRKPRVTEPVEDVPAE